jgi:hypothetical protein
MIMDDTVGKYNKKTIGHSSPRYTSENISEARGPSVSLMGRDPF